MSHNLAAPLLLAAMEFGGKIGFFGVEGVFEDPEKNIRGIVKPFSLYLKSIAG